MSKINPKTTKKDFTLQVNQVRSFFSVVFTKEKFLNHGQLEVNVKKVNIPSYLVKAVDIITVRESKKYNSTLKANIELNSARPIPAWLERNNENLSGKVIRLSAREDIDLPIEEHLIVELYSK